MGMIIAFISLQRPFMKILFYILSSFLLISNLQSQNKFELTNDNNIAEIPFQFINNLIILDVNINGQHLNLVFDTGVKETVLINMQQNDSIDYKNVKTIYFTGIGNEKKKIAGKQSSGNTINLNNQIINSNGLIYIITDYEFKFSERIGININGFIGGDLINNHLVKVDYRKKKIYFYPKNSFPPKKLKKYTAKPITMLKGKPYIDAYVTFGENEQPQQVKLLIDTGNSDAVWVFLSKKIHLSKKQKYINDYMGLGFSGRIEGKRVKSHLFSIDDKYKFENVYTALPDAIYFSGYIKKGVHGMIGNEVLKRFFIIFDYPNKRIYLKKYRRNYRQDFLFNDSGIFLAYKGKIPIKIKSLETQYHFGEPNKGTLLVTSSSYTFKYKMVNQIIISYIRKDSPADKAGLLKGDALLEINGNSVYQYRLEQIDKKFFFKNNKRMDFTILRNGLKLRYHIENVKQF